METVEKAKTCHLLRIPPELRLRIYNYVYDERSKVDIELYSD